jgi:predicted transcriptional regulator
MVWIPRDITDAELAVLRVLWNRGPSTIRELTDRLYPGGTHSHYATVQSLLDRLSGKECAAHERQGRVKVYTATVSRAQVIAKRLRETADALCDGSLAPLLSHLVNGVQMSDQELEALEGLIERLDQQAGDESPDATGSG